MAEELLAAFKLLFMLFSLFVSYSMFKKGRYLQLKGLNALGYVFLFTAIAMALSTSRSIDLDLITSKRFFLYTSVSLAAVAYAYFVHFTFYEGKKGLTRAIIIFLSVGAILHAGLLCYAEFILEESADNFNDPIPISELNPAFLIANLILGAMIILVSGWRFLCALQSYNNIQERKTVEDWVKFRYKLILWASICYTAWGILIAAPITEDIFARALMTTAALLACILEFIAWGMPEWLKQFANRNYETLEGEEMHEDEILAIMRGS